MTVLDYARKYVAAGLSVIPVRADGSKAPALAKGEVEQYRERFAKDEELVAWFTPPRAVGLAVVCGAISGNLAVLDFESQFAWDRWFERMNTAGRTRLFANCPIVRTPKGGRHLYCRISESWVGGCKLAMVAKNETLIEVRGQGHYVLAPGCPIGCHQLNKPYTFEAKGWLSDAI
jgi:hypothetical protein